MAEVAKNSRLVVAGDIIRPKGTRRQEVVRGVSVVLHMANGQDLVYEAGEEVAILDKEDLADIEAELETT